MQKSSGVIKVLSDLVAVDSQTYKGNKKIISLLKEWFSEYDYQLQDWVTDNDVEGQNLIVKIPGKSSDRSIVFVCHMDTVPTSELWETDPFILEEQEGKLYGLGACDTKGGVASLIEAVFSLDDQPAYDTYIVFDGDEEDIWVGLKKYKKGLKLKKPTFICVEPTDRNLCIADRTIFSFEIHTFGKAQHASYATPEVNQTASAIYKMQQIIDVLIQDATRLAKEYDDVMGTNTQNLGVIQGGTAENVLPEFCRLQVDRRLLANKDIEKEVGRIKQLVTSIDPSARVARVFGEKGFSTPKDNISVQQVLSSVLKKYPKATTTCFQAMSEGTIFQELGDVLVLGPGSIKQAHVANEFVEAADLFNFVHIFQDIMLTA